MTADASLASTPPAGRGPSRWTDPGFWVILIGLIVVIAMSVLILQHFNDGGEPAPTTPANMVGAPAPMPAIPSVVLGPAC